MHLNFTILCVICFLLFFSCFGGARNEQSPPDRLGMEALWAKGMTGKGVRVGTFDTGIATKHVNFHSSKRQVVKLCRGYSTQKTCEDGFGHGSFVGGIIAAQENSFNTCGRGIAPEADLYTFKVFTDQQVSYTSWLLDALNEALLLDLDVINLSIGGYDFHDAPFTDKLREVASAGVTIVTACGNDGPQFGTIFNPADQGEVVGVGAFAGRSGLERVSGFSARGITSAELPFLIGKVKPDVLALGENVWGVNHRGGCKSLSGTSVAAPVVTGLLAALSSGVRAKGFKPNPALLKQLLLETAESLPPPCGPQLSNPCWQAAKALGSSRASKMWRGSSLLPSPHTWQYDPLVFDTMLERSFYVQGAGQINAHRAAASVDTLQKLRVSVFPDVLDLVNDPSRWWPFSDMAVFYSGMPICVNLTVLNPLSPVGRIRPDFARVELRDGQRNKIPLSSAALSVFLVVGSERFWPWAGAVAVCFRGRRDVDVEQIFQGTITVPVVAYQFPITDDTIPKPKSSRITINDGPTDRQQQMQRHHVPVHFRVRQIPKPPRRRRLLWDMSHQLLYPPAFIPRDNIDVTADVLEWHGDHPFLNFRHAFNTLRRAGYFVEIWNSMYYQLNQSSSGGSALSIAGDLSHIDPTLYGALLVIDPEEYFYAREVQKVREFVAHHGMGLVIISEWYDTEVMLKLGYTDDNTGEYWTPVTGGANVPALNSLLEPFGVELGGTAYAGVVEFSSMGNSQQRPTVSGSMGSIRKLPPKATWCHSTYKVGPLMNNWRMGMFRPSPMTESEAPPLIALVDTADLKKTGRQRPGASYGRIAVFTDSDCLDASHNMGHHYCLPLFLNLVAYASDHGLIMNEVSFLRDAPCQTVAESKGVVLDPFNGIEIRHSGKNGPHSSISRPVKFPSLVDLRTPHLLEKYAKEDPLFVVSPVLQDFFQGNISGFGGLRRERSFEPHWGNDWNVFQKEQLLQNASVGIGSVCRIPALVGDNDADTSSTSSSSQDDILEPTAEKFTGDPLASPQPWPQLAVVAAAMFCCVGFGIALIMKQKKKHKV